MKLKNIATSLIFGMLLGLAPQVASADVSLPAPPKFNDVSLEVLADNDFAVFMGNDQEITRLFYQNTFSWYAQVAGIKTLNVYPGPGETFVYIMPMGGDEYIPPSAGEGGQENWSGRLNNIYLLDYPGAEVAIGRRVPDPRDIIHFGYLLFNNYLPGFTTSANTIADGIFDPSESDVIAATKNLIWGPAVRSNSPDIKVPNISNPVSDCEVACRVERFVPPLPTDAWNFPDGSAVLFRYPISSANLPVNPGDRQVTVTWVDPTSGGTVDEYLIEYKETSQPDTAFKTFGRVPGTARSSTVTGLTNGTPYTLRVTAINSAGSASNLGRSVIPIGTPSRPSNQSYAADNGSVSINFSPPENDGGMAVTNYAYSIDDGANWVTRTPASVDSPITISGLTNNQNYSVRLRAINPYGAGQASLPIAVKPGLSTERTLTYVSGTLASVEGMPSGATLNEGDSFTVSPGPTRTNFTFTGWKDGTVAYAPGDTYTVGASNPTLTAQWVQNSLLGVTPGSRSRVLTWNITAGQSIDVTVAAGPDNSVRIQIPDGALPDGTEVIFWRLLNDDLAKERIDGSKDYLVNLAVTWSIGDDVTTPMDVVNATTPIVLTITNPNIAMGAKAWQIIGNNAQVIGTATRAGVLALQFTEDPVITAANMPPSPIFNTPVSTADGFTVDIINYDSAYTWDDPTVSAGVVSVTTTSGSIRSLVVTGLTVGQSATITQRLLHNSVYQTETVTGAALSPIPVRNSRAVTSIEPVSAAPTVSPGVSTSPTAKPKIIAGFKPGSWLLTKSIKKSLDSLLSTSAKVSEITCIGYTMGPTILKSDQNLANRRALAACSYLIEKAPAGTKIKIWGKTTRERSEGFRRVSVTITE